MTDKENPNFIERFTIRMPDGMRDAIADRAKQNGRSMNSEIIDMINSAMNLPATGQEAIDHMLEVARSDAVASLSDGDRDRVESLLLDLAQMTSKKIEQGSRNLSQILSLIARVKSPLD